MIQHPSKTDRESGLSLLEIVVAVAIIGIIAVIVFFSWRNVVDNAKQTAVDQAADRVFTTATAYLLDANPRTAPADAVFEFNNSQVGQNERIISEVQELDDDRLRVTAYYESRSHIAIRETPQGRSDRNPWIDEDGNMRPPTGDTIINMSYQCDETKNGYLAIVNISPDTTITMWETDNMAETITTLEYTRPTATFELRPEARQEILRSRLIDEVGMDEANRRIDEYIATGGNEHPAFAEDLTISNVSPLVRMDAGVKYSVSYDGEIETFAAPGHRPGQNSPRSLADCLVSIDHFGDNTNLRNLVYLGGDKLTSVPDNLPTSVVSLRAAFENTTNFNDPNIRYWRTDNVAVMRSTFYNSSSFNQDLNTWRDEETGETYWDVSNLRDARMMFQHAKNFNNGENPGSSTAPLEWDTGNVNNMRQMFRNAQSFNQNIGSWDTSNVTDMMSIFVDAKSFNQDISAWNVDNATINNAWANNSGLEEQHKPPAWR